jgi:hypothetical protein
VTASQAGNTNYSSAPNVTQGFTVNQAAQTISFNSPGSVPYGAEPFTLSATSTSGLSVTLTSTTSGVCSVSGATVTIVGGGTCSLTASQAGNANYLAASSATQSFTVSQATQAITFIQRSGRDAAEQRHCDAGRDVDFGAGSQLCVPTALRYARFPAARSLWLPWEPARLRPARRGIPVTYPRPPASKASA